MTALIKRKTEALALAELQGLLQAAILEGDTAILGFIQDNSRTSRETLFDVYRHAYSGRLVETLKNEYPLLNHYVGEARFREVARGYIAAYPSRTQNARWFGTRLPEYLEGLGRDAIAQDVVGLSSIEKAVSDAFDAPDKPVLDVADLGRFAPETWGRLVFAPHPSVTHLHLAGNILEIWRALQADEPTPAFASSPELQRLVVWRRAYAPMVRELNYEECMIWTEASRGASFQSLCEMLATYDDPDSAAVRAAGYLHGWLTSGMLTSVQLAENV